MLFFFCLEICLFNRNWLCPPWGLLGTSLSWNRVSSKHCAQVKAVQGFLFQHDVSHSSFSSLWVSQRKELDDLLQNRSALMKEVSVFVLAWKASLPRKNSADKKALEDGWMNGWSWNMSKQISNFETSSWAFGSTEASRCGAWSGKALTN